MDGSCSGDVRRDAPGVSSLGPRTGSGSFERGTPLPRGLDLDLLRRVWISVGVREGRWDPQPQLTSLCGRGVPILEISIADWWRGETGAKGSGASSPLPPCPPHESPDRQDPPRSVIDRSNAQRSRVRPRGHPQWRNDHVQESSAAYDRLRAISGRRVHGRERRGNASVRRAGHRSSAPSEQRERVHQTQTQKPCVGTSEREKKSLHGATGSFAPKCEVARIPRRQAQAGRIAACCTTAFEKQIGLERSIWTPFLRSREGPGSCFTDES